jgi:hypothetical protein
MIDDPSLLAANVSPMNDVNRTRTNVSDRNRNRQYFRDFLAPEARS